jgi:glycosyltransferase involved in cell wall biosynthesis
VSSAPTTTPARARAPVSHVGPPARGGRALAPPRRASAPRPALSLVFPVRDEERNVGPLIDAALAVATQLAPDFELVVVDDGSRDGSAALLEARQSKEPRLRVLTHPANRGYGAALRTGLRAARGELVFFSDADLQFELAELEALLALAGSCDVAAGYRAPRRDPWPRRALAFGWGTCVWLLFGLPVRDIDCAFKVFHRRVLEAIPIASIGAFVNTEILVRAQRLGFRIREVPVSHRPRVHGRQSGARPRVILRALLELATLYRELRRTPPARHAGAPR